MPYNFFRLVNSMEYLTTWSVRLSDMFRQLSNFSWKGETTLKWLNHKYICKDIICPSQVNARRMLQTALWNVTQSSLSLAHTCGHSFGNRNIPRYLVLSMGYPHIGQYISITCTLVALQNIFRRLLMSKHTFI